MGGGGTTKVGEEQRKSWSLYFTLLFFSSKANFDPQGKRGGVRKQ